jgi:ABC-type bacteriocin/lantibiotic exporter with double-glycine peptidase domain
MAGFLVVAAGFLAACEKDDDTSFDADRGADSINLGIADRAWAPGHDDVGWCGEACIQMAMAYYGHEVSQEEINRAAGSPPDIIEDNMNRALNELGVKYDAWDESCGDVNQFIAWIKDHLRRGRPVICGTKIYPDETPEWYVDHFVVAAGFNPGGLLLNTQLNCDGPQWISYAQLASQNSGYAFQNSRSRYFGRAITGVR